jgi:hypothetical protein
VAEGVYREAWHSGKVLRHWQKAAAMVNAILDAGLTCPYMTRGLYITPRVTTFPFLFFSLALDSRL